MKFNPKALPAWATYVERPGKVFKDENKWVKLDTDVVFPKVIAFLKGKGYKVEPLTHSVLEFVKRFVTRYIKVFIGTPFNLWIPVSADKENPYKWGAKSKVQYPVGNPMPIDNIMLANLLNEFKQTEELEKKK